MSRERSIEEIAWTIEFCCHLALALHARQHAMIRRNFTQYTKVLACVLDSGQMFFLSSIAVAAEAQILVSSNRSPDDVSWVNASKMCFTNNWMDSQKLSISALTEIAQ